MFSDTLKALRKESGMSQRELAEKLGFTQQAIGKWEVGKNFPDEKVLLKIAQIFDVSVDYLLGNEGKNSNKKDASDGLPPLTPKDERDIARDLEKILNSLDDKNAMAAMGGTVDDEEDRELLRASLLTSMRLAKQIAKKKFTPKKYRHDDEE